MSIRVLIADDHKILRDGLVALMGNLPEIEVVAETEDGEQAVAMARSMKPDVAILDISMPRKNGIEATRDILSTHPEMKILALSMHDDKQYVSGMLHAGASGFLLKDCAFEELSLAINAVIHEQVYLSPKITGRVVEDYFRHVPGSGRAASRSLTRREQQVLTMIADGKSTRDIAAQLNVSTKTIESHRKNIMDKLGIFSIAELTKFAVREGLVALE